uniref:Receptor-like protein kinase FERONIA n=1 Tax=Tanacetum cinerariifolium TaxID=118510 RepID=A0A699IDI1_TANCI|nr:receptor-like protein kinase FERONIA [Tanacetum cinerariifolium]
MLLLFTTATSAQPYKATERFLLNCGSFNTTTISDQKWDGDKRSEFVPSNITKTRSDAGGDGPPILPLSKNSSSM